MFEITWQDKNSRARTGTLSLAHGKVETPVFMPVGTKAAVKTLSSQDLEDIGIQIILSNTYHLNYRPGMEIIKAHKDLHGFMNWNRPILTDSGGFQVFSLSNHAKITDDGVEFRYPESGELSFFTPEKVIEIQKTLNSDVVMILDQPVAYPCNRSDAEIALERTTRWAQISKKQNLNPGQKMFGIMQGSTFKDLREKSANDLVKLNFDGYAIGGLSVGEPMDVLYEVLNYSTDFLPKDKPRYLMGVGDPLSLVKAISMGVDMFDCVLPTRIARNGAAFTSKGQLNLKNSVYKDSLQPLDSNCSCNVCSTYTRSYLRHLYMNSEILAHRLLSLHNLFYLKKITDKAKSFAKKGKLLELENELRSYYE